MEIFHGIMKSHSDRKSDKYISVNNFGYFKKTERIINTLRKSGRSDYQIIYIENGTGTFTFDKKVYNLRSGNVVIFRPFERQEYYFSLNSNYYWVHFTGTGVEKLLDELKLNDTFFYTGEFFGFKEVFEKMIKDNAINDVATASLLSAHVISLLSLTSRKLHTTDSVIHRAIEKMQTDFTSKLTIEDYAKICGLSEYHFIRKFKKETSLTPLQYKNKVIVTKATELLETTNLNISEIAHLLGFEDSLYFSRVFKKEKGVSPKRYISLK